MNKQIRGIFTIALLTLSSGTAIASDGLVQITANHNGIADTCSLEVMNLEIAWDVHKRNGPEGESPIEFLTSFAELLESADRAKCSLIVKIKKENHYKSTYIAVNTEEDSVCLNASTFISCREVMKFNFDFMVENISTGEVLPGIAIHFAD